MRILIIDDDVPTTEVIRDRVNWKMLQIECIDIAHNIQTAKKHLVNNLPDVILCDIEMPQGSGLDFLEWLRAEGYDCHLIFLTCHENFAYATTAIKHNVLDYITKPFQINKLEVALAKAVEQTIHKKNIKQDLAFKDYWLDNKNMLEESFWRDLLFYVISAEHDTMLSECKKRHLSVDLNDKFSLVLCSVPRRMPEKEGWNESAFRYALRNLTSELILNSFDNLRNLIYSRNECFYDLIVLQNPDKQFIRRQCEKLVKEASTHLSCEVKCYISPTHNAYELPSVRDQLEQADKQNVSECGGVLFLDECNDLPQEKISIDINLLQNLLNEGKALEAINFIGQKLQTMSSSNALTYTALNHALADYNQIIYAKLQNHSIHAHELFGDDSAVKLRQQSELSLFDAMKWISYSTSRTIEYIEETKRLEGVVAKIKRYIAEHINEPVTRADIASSVYLTPDYVSKIFKAETGESLKDYMNKTRIYEAKKLLLNTNLTVSEIAVNVGFDNFSYFSTLFKKITGTTPSSFSIKK